VKHKIKLGLEVFLENAAGSSDQRFGLVCNQASVNHHFVHAADLFKEKLGKNLTVLFGPQHGIRGDVQDNMIETKHSLDSATQTPIYSLYSETREPTEEMLENVDVLVVDLFDIGCRVYTFIYTMANCMLAAQKYNKKIVVCDRPNPINGVAVEGSVLDPKFSSFVGQFPIVMRHGLTIGELALLFQKAFGIECDLEIVKMENWQRGYWYDDTDAPWVMPSPNMPTIETATVFPGTVLFEGTQISEGRGTTRPFEIVGAPYIQPEEFARAMNELNLPGVYFRPNSFLPTFQKHHQIPCGGVQIHVLERDKYQSVLTGIALVKTTYEMYTNQFEWKQPPYEYVYDQNPFDVIAGGSKLREQIEAKTDLSEIENDWNIELANFKELRRSILIY
jgi:uncharacterized protein YbbC (DUF1343 family)